MSAFSIYTTDVAVVAAAQPQTRSPAGRVRAAASESRLSGRKRKLRENPCGAADQNQHPNVRSKLSCTATVEAEAAAEVEVDACGDPRAKQSDVVTVLELVDLKPFVDPNNAHANMFSGVSSSDWGTQFRAIEGFRRLCRHHPESLSTHM